MQLLLIFAVFVLAGCERNIGLSNVDEAPEYVSDEEALRFVQACKESIKATGHSHQLPSRRMADGPYRWVTIPYTLDASSQTVQLSTSVTLDLGPIPAYEQAHYWRRLQNIRQCIRGFYLANDIYLNLTFFRSGEQGGVAPGYPAYVTVRKSGVRLETFNMSNWAFEMDGIALNDETACTVISHELGHMFGLRDEYLDSRVVNRRLGEPDSLMRVCQVLPNQARLYPNHLRTILKYGCENRSAKIPIWESFDRAEGPLPF